MRDYMKYRPKVKSGKKKDNSRIRSLRRRSERQREAQAARPSAYEHDRSDHDSMSA